MERLFAAEDGFDPASLARAAESAGAEVVATAVERVNAEFADTVDMRLLRWDVTLSHERGTGWRIRDGLVDHTVAGIGPGVPPEACSLAFGVARGEAVAVRSRVRVGRRGVDIVSRRGAALAAVRVDDVEVVDAAGSELAAWSTAVPAGTRFAVVRLVWGAGAGPELVGRLQRRIERRGCRLVADTWVAARAMGALDAPSEVDVSEAGPGSTIADVVRAALEGSVVRLVRHDPLTRVGVDPEGVHQMRVATRRLRSDLATFESVLDTAVTRPLREELAWLAALLGGVRDVDVLSERFARAVTALAGTDRVAGERLLARLVEDQAVARAHLLEAMTSGRYAQLLDRMVDLARTPPLEGRTGRKAAKVAGALVPDRSLRRAIRRLGPDPGNRALHRVRIKAKRCRYAAEAVAPVFGRDADRYAAAMSRCQDVLGAHTDAVVAEAWLRRAAAHGSRQEAFVAGRLAAEERTRSTAQLASWPALRDELVAKDLRRWLR